MSLCLHVIRCTIKHCITNILLLLCRWTRQWTSEENRHGDLMNKYCYLSGKVNMRVSTLLMYLPECSLSVPRLLLDLHLAWPADVLC